MRKYNVMYQVKRANCLQITFAKIQVRLNIFFLIKRIFSTLFYLLEFYAIYNWNILLGVYTLGAGSYVYKTP